MNDKTCRTCADNDDGLCDRTGYLVDEDDSCKNHRDCNGCFGASFGDCQRCETRLYGGKQMAEQELEDTEQEEFIRRREKKRERRKHRRNETD